LGAFSPHLHAHAEHLAVVGEFYERLSTGKGHRSSFTNSALTTIGAARAAIIVKHNSTVVSIFGMKIMKAIPSVNTFAKN
jgi:hypothetical protein